MNNIPISSIFHTSYEEIKRRASLCKRADAEYLTAKYIITESRRQNLVHHLRLLRKQLIKNENESSTDHGGSFEQNIYENDFI